MIIDELKFKMIFNAIGLNPVSIKVIVKQIEGGVEPFV
jgi:hypothetical protein